MEFPDDFTELGAAIVDADSVLINKRYTTFARIKTWILALVGTSSGTLAAGNDSRFTDSRAPSGSAGGSLAGTYPNPSIAAGAIGGTEIASGIKDPAAGTAGLRTLGTSSTSACAGNDSRLSDTRTPTDASVTTAKLDATLSAKVARLTAKRTVTGTTGTLATTDKILAINASNNFTLTLPTASSASGMDFLLQRIDIASAYTLTLALDSADASDGRLIYFQGNTPSAGASLTVAGANSQTRPGFLLWSDGTDWYIA